MKPPLEPYHPPKPLEKTPAKMNGYPTAWVVFNYTLIPAWVGMVMAVFFIFASIGESWSAFDAFSMVASLFGFPIMAMVIYGIPALITGICIAALRLQRQFHDAFKAAAMGFIGGALPALVMGDDKMTAILMFGCIAGVGSFIMAWRVLPKNNTVNPLADG